MTDDRFCGRLGCRNPAYAIVDTDRGERTVCEDHADEQDILAVIA